MRIAMVGSRGVPAMLSGVERVVEELSAELSARGHEVIIYARPWYLRAVRDTRYAGPSSVVSTPGLPGKYTDAITHTFTAMFDAIRRKVDLVHIHCAGPALMSFIASMASLPVVFTVHAPEWDRARWSFVGRLALRAGLACGMKCASAISAVAENVATVLIVAPIAIELARRLKVSSAPFLVGIAVSSNLQGTATLIGDPPSMILAAHYGLNFDDFFWYGGRPGIFFAVQVGSHAGKSNGLRGAEFLTVIPMCVIMKPRFDQYRVHQSVFAAVPIVVFSNIVIDYKNALILGWAQYVETALGRCLVKGAVVIHRPQDQPLAPLHSDQRRRGEGRSAIACLLLQADAG